MKKNLRINKILLIIVIILLTVPNLMAQTDKTFWFVAPEISSGQIDTPLVISIITTNLPAHVTISEPANPSFVSYTYDIPANSIQKVDLTSQKNKVENTFVNGGKSNKGILIKSDVNVTVYYELDNDLDPDIFTLKGNNALGKDFFAPFQTDSYNYNYNSGNGVVPRPYSAIDVVFTEDNTFLHITPARNATYPDHTVGSTYNKGPFYKGQTYTIVPKKTVLPPGGYSDFYDHFGRSAEDHIGGTRIQSNKNIAITVKDDEVYGGAYPGVSGCRDLCGDQIIPTSVIGKQYIAMKGQLSITSGNYERVYVVGTENSTIITKDDSVYVATINKGETCVLEVTNSFLFISADKPVYALQVSGFGCEKGEAILPPVDVCTGSTQVGFTRSTSDGFFLNIMVRASSKDARSHFYINGVLQDGTANPGVLFGPADFDSVPGTSHWLVYRTGDIGTGVIPVGAQTLIKNTGDVFHLGIINGTKHKGTRFGYFSNFNELKVNAFATGTESGNIRLCEGESTQLSAEGGTNIVWSPSDYLDDPHSANPVATPPSTMNYMVVVSGACDMTDSANVTVEVSTPLEANFTIDTTYGCSPVTVSIHDKSLGVNKYFWDFGDGSTLNYVETQDTIEADTTFLHTFINNSDTSRTYTIQLLVKNTNDCTDTLRRNVIVYPYAKAKFDLDDMNDTLGCHPVNIDFNNKSEHGKYYLWEFGDGGSSNDSIPSHTFNNFGLSDSVYTVSLVTTTEHFCRDTAYQDIYVHPYIKADFDFDPSIHCNPYTVDISNTSLGAGLSYDWYFGDSQTSDTSASSFTHTYNNTSGVTKDYELKLVLTGSGGCSDSLTRIVTVYPNIEAGFTIDKDNACNPLKVKFTDTSSGVDVYDWDFGDGSSSSLKDTSHTFLNLSNTNDTSYIVTLTTYSTLGCADVFQDTVTVYHNPYAQFTVDSSSGCSPHDVYINNSSIGQDSCSWNFGDLQTSDTCATSFTHNYNYNGATQKIYDITLITSTTHGCKDNLVQNATVFPNISSEFVADTIIGCNPLTVTFNSSSSIGVKNYIWDFGDGSTSNEATPTHTFLNSSFTTDSVYKVTLTTTNDYGCIAKSNTNITVYAKPNAEFTVDNSPGCSPYNISISNSSVCDSAYSWNFGDGSPLSDTCAASFSHLYDNDSTVQKIYKITLNITSTHGCKDNLVQNATVFPNISSKFSVDIDGCNPFNANFTNSSIGATGYVWDFGDGSTSNDATTSHTYLNNSFTNDTSFNVSLTTTNDYGCTAKSDTIITVYAKPKADFIVDNSAGCSPYTINISNNSVGVDSCYWYFGEGDTVSTGNVSAISHKYNNSGNVQKVFSINLIVQSTHGCSDTISQTATIYPNISSDFNVDIKGCNPFTVSFGNSSGGATSYSWDFGDGSFSTAENPKHTFYNTSNYNNKQFKVSLITHNDYGCKADYDTVITVYPKPKAEFVIDNTPVCSPDTIKITNNSLGADSCYWYFGEGDTVSTGNVSAISHFYNNDGSNQEIFNIHLITNTNNGCSDTIARNATIYPNISSKFDSKISGCHPLAIKFNNESKGATGYSWNFGDGTSSGEKNPSHTFYNYSNTDRALSKVTLTTINDFNCSAVYDTNITIYPVPDAIFTLDSSTSCSPFEVVIHNSSPGASHYLWNFDDNTSLDTNQTDTLHHIYHNYTDLPVSKTIKLYVNNINGCEDSTSQPVFIYPEVVAAFDADNYDGCHPLIVQFTNKTNSVATIYDWKFDDGVESDLKDPKHIFVNNTQDDYTYHVKLTGYSDYGCKNSVTREITVHPMPLADFDIHDKTQIYPNSTVSFIDKTSLGKWYYHWNFGDDYTSKKQNPSHTYSTWNDYLVTLVVGNSYCVDTIQRVVTITAPQPKAVFAQPESGCPPVTVYFTCDTSYIKDYYWDFGNGVSSHYRFPNVSFPRYTYYNSGKYTVKLKVSGDGGIDSVTHDLVVYDLPQAMFSVNPQKVKLSDDPIQCQNMSSLNSSSYLWDFGDNTMQSTEFEPTHQYTNEGEFNITLYVKTDEGCVDTFEIQNAVRAEEHCSLKFPNVFTPSKSGPSDGRYNVNDVSDNIFYPRFIEGIRDYDLKIFNRWGELLFETKDIDIGWNGYYLGKLCKQDVYVWKVVAKCSNGHDIINAGNVTLIR